VRLSEYTYSALSNFVSRLLTSYLPRALQELSGSSSQSFSRTPLLPFLEQFSTMSSSAVDTSSPHDSSEDREAGNLQVDESAPVSPHPRLSTPPEIGTLSLMLSESNNFQTELKAYAQNFVYRWLNAIHEGLEIYETKGATHYQAYIRLCDLSRELFFALNRFKDCERITTEAINESPLFAFDYAKWPPLLRSPLRSGAGEEMAAIRERCLTLIGELGATRARLRLITATWEVGTPNTEDRFDSDLKLELPEMEAVFLVRQVLQRMGEGLSHFSERCGQR
jgi:hypothetical protein